ncbi:major allergen Pru ar 1-like [Punica granatum]|uniref:Bet v I/Major latex protein domain-containing protein n=2 Tax=Punica granatum TaxID=22663 RepID=A0A218XTH7_PUNGR|nr:major allergen Pru ar 1-like [Punica granatum]OWM88130.1 hypothetical protein CDL15_Pgr016703 [Punica granatum]PKI56717.1 hypothetical protein CRG98_022877 [Punica granatum]
MGFIAKELEIASPIPPAKIFKAFVLDADELFPKIVPQAFKSVEILEGDGGPGSIKKITFGEAEQFKHAKHRVDVLDKEKFVYHYSWIEGDALMHVFEKISYEIKVEAGHDGGSVTKITTKFFTIGDVHLNEEQLNSGKEKVIGLFKAVEDYVLANPEYA